MPQKPSFTIDEEGTIRLLRKDIYGRSDVFLRELIQNALDSGASKICLYLLLKDDKKVWGILCHDNGKGMSKNEIQNYFLRLCKRYPVDDSPRYARYGIGVFTYLAFAKKIHLVTKKTRGKGWYLHITAPNKISSLDEIVISDYIRVEEYIDGTGVLLEFQDAKRLSELINSLKYYLRYTLPSKLILKKTNSKFDLKINNYKTFLNTIDSVSSPINFYDDRYVPQYAINVTKTGCVKGGYIYFNPGYPSQISICEDGIHVDDSCQDLIPSRYQNLGIQGLLNVKRGWLDIDAARLKVQRSVKFRFLAEIIERSVLISATKHFSHNEVSIDDRWSSNAKLLNELLLILSEKKGAEILYNSANKIRVKIYSNRYSSSSYSTLLNVAQVAKSYGQIFCVDGLDWGWKKNAGNIKGYNLEIFIRQSDYAKIAYSKGATVLEIPKRTEEGLLIPKGTLTHFFLEYFNIILLDVTNVSQGKPSGSQLPLKWRSNLNIPPTISYSKLPYNCELFLDYHLRAVIDINKGIFQHIEKILTNNNSLAGLEKSIIEIYLHLATADISAALRKLEQVITNDIKTERDRHISFSTLIEEITNGG